MTAAERPTNKYRVIQWGVGYTGASSLRYIVNNPNLDLVGIKCFTPEKDGKTAREICGHGPEEGVTATRDINKLLAHKADCVVFMPRDFFDDPSVPGGPSEDWMRDLVALLESGANVTSPVVSGIHTRQQKNPESFIARLNAACAKGGSTITFNGFDPGFTTDYLPFILASAVGEVTQIRTWEFLDYSSYPVPEILNAMGLGIEPTQLTSEALGAIATIWSSGLYLLGDSMAAPVDDIKLDAETYLAPSAFTTAGGMNIKAGSIGALWWKLRGFSNGAERFIINHVTRMSADMAPAWPTIGTDGGYRIEIDSYPPVRVDMPLGLPGGAGSSFADAMVMTAARCVNSIDAVVTASPGYKNFLDLRPVGGRYTLSAR